MKFNGYRLALWLMRAAIAATVSVPLFFVVTGLTWVVMDNVRAALAIVAGALGCIGILALLAVLYDWLERKSDEATL